MSDAKRFEGMTAVVTGGASGIGLGVAKRIAAEGGRVMIWDMGAARLKDAVAEVGAKFSLAAEVNVTDPNAVERATLDRRRRDGPYRRARLQRRASPATTRWSSTIRSRNGSACSTSTSTALFYCNRFVARLMKARGYGRIVNIASIAGKEGNPTACAYSASKAAVIGLTKSLGKELAKDGITVNAIAPATIETPILEQVSAAHIAYMRSKIPMDRFGTVDEAAALITWLGEPRMLVHAPARSSTFRAAARPY